MIGRELGEVVINSGTMNMTPRIEMPSVLQSKWTRVDAEIFLYDQISSQERILSGAAACT